MNNEPKNKSEADTKHKFEYQRNLVQQAHKAFHETSPHLLHGVHDEHDIAAQMRQIANERDKLLRDNALLREVVEMNGSPTWPHVLAFAKRMEAKLAKNRHKGDREAWLKDNPDDLWFRLEEETMELQTAIADVRHKENIVASEREQVANEAADVANFAMMIADIYTGPKAKLDGGAK